MTTEYVLGFMMSNGQKDEYGNFALIWKQRPEWQAGLLNGIGGHIEENESPIEAMVREFKEETGYTQKKWKQFGIMSGPNYVVYLFCCEGATHKLKTITDERVDLRRIEDQDGTFIENLAMLMQMAHFSWHAKDDVVINITYK